MPRLPRLHVPGGCYHAILRGNHREALFATPRDRQMLGEIVEEAVGKLGVRVHAFCWMTNHLHVLVQIGEQPLGKVMQRIAMRYSRYRHRELHTSGHLFERRHRAWLVEADRYFVALLRYIHLNPVAANMVRAAEDYPWSSHRAYLGEAGPAWLTTDFGLSLLGQTRESARRAYRELMSTVMYASEERLFDTARADDPRVLGGDQFLASLPAPLIKPRSALTLAQLAEEICRRQGVSVEQLRSRTRTESLTAARLQLAREAMEGRVASLSEIARYLGRSPSSLSELLIRHTR
jgi:REP element-mobilizing transposase RayT